MDSNKPCKPVVVKGWVYGQTYDNPKEWKGWRKPGVGTLVQLKMEKNEASIPLNKEELEVTLPVHRVGNAEKQKLNNPPKSDIQIMWIGHATLLVQFDGLTVLTDPVFLDRCAPVQFAGPKRYRPVPCQVEDLPKIDAVVISHNHYDHLEHDAVQKLNRKFGKKLKWFVPEGLKGWFAKYGCENVVELTWWEQADLNNGSGSAATFYCVPAQHWSQRGPLDAMMSLWCGWVVKTNCHTFYYSGDTGYCPVFEEIGRRFGPMDLSAIPIGCFKPREHMKAQHIGPEEAVDIHKEVKSKRSVGIHWGTFDGLGSLEYYLAPRDDLEKAVKEKGLQNEEFFTVHHGEIKIITPSDGDFKEKSAL